MTRLFLIAIGGALGALARYGVGLLVQGRVPASQFPWGTFVINVTGSFVLGFLMTLFASGIVKREHLQPLIAIGFIGAYTTFSTFEYETAQLGSSWRAMFNLAGSVFVGYFAVWLGIKLAALFGAGR